MSRSALWHQEKNVQRRQQEADEAWEAVIEEGRNNQRNNNSKNNKVLALWGPDDSFRLEPMLLNNIKKSNYFIKICQEIHDWTSLVDEIYYRVDHMEPWAVGTYVCICGWVGERVRERKRERVIHGLKSSWLELQSQIVLKQHCCLCFLFPLSLFCCCCCVVVLLC